MKKLFALLLAAVMLLTFAACAGDGDTQAPKTTEIIPDVDADTVGGKLWNAFYDSITANPDATAEELADHIAAAGVVPYSLDGIVLNDLFAPSDEGELYLQGFGNHDFAGLDPEKSAVFLPMIGSTPFIGYVFELSNEADAESFIKTLEENANLRWQICVAADQLVAGSVGNKVFFVMCRTTIE